MNFLVRMVTVSFMMAAAAEAEERGRGPADRRPGRAAAARGDPQGRLAFSKLCIISASEIKEKWI